jgi:hypothetical protein
MEMQRSSGSRTGHRGGRTPRPRAGAAIAGLIAALAVLAPSPRAHAQTPDRPLPLPTRDVTVVYQVSGADQMEGAQKLQVMYADGGDRTRVDYFRWPEAKSPFAELIFDRPANHVLAVLTEQRSYIEREVGEIENPGRFLRPGLRYSRQGQVTVAGLACTEWKIRQSDKDEDFGSICVTEDGVALRLTSATGPASSLTATLVAYGAPPAGVFDPPADYERQTAR